jgi:hypothetical protein
MMALPSILLHGVCLGFLRAVALLVPAWQRADWLKEWRAELWHVRRECSRSRRARWRVEWDVAAFCVGSLDDARCLREQRMSPVVRRIPLATTMGSASQCVLFLGSVLVVCGGLAFLLPGVRAEIFRVHYRQANRLVMIQDAQYPGDAKPTIPGSQFLAWTRRRQDVFEEFAFYQVRWETLRGAETPGLNGRGPLGVAWSSANLLELLGLPVRFALPASRQDKALPALLLSDEIWRRRFGQDAHLLGRVVQVGQQKAVVAGILPPQAWRLPGSIDAWLLLPEPALETAGEGFLVGRVKHLGDVAGWGERWRLSARRVDGTEADLLCISLAERARTPWSLFLFSVLMACLALPATTSLPLGEYPLNSSRLSWATRLRRWSFLATKLALLLPIVYFVSVDLAYLEPGRRDALSAQSIQLAASFALCLFGLRWMLRDQRQRCPVCLGKLTHPARVGQASRTFLDWNGTELICVGGHGLLHIPELPTSWFSTQRWLYLDPSWEVLFLEEELVSAG